LGATAVSVPGADGGTASPVVEVIVVMSFVVLLAVLVSPPPLTLAVLVTLAGALLATFTVSVSAG
jgi:hypothetical protein